MPGTTKAEDKNVPRPHGSGVRQPRCVRCIKQHKPCDGGHPCSLCTKVATKQNSEKCWYPPGMPSRRQLKEHEEAYARIHDLMEQRESIGRPLSAKELEALLPVYPIQGSPKKAAAADDDVSSENEEIDVRSATEAPHGATNEQMRSKLSEYIALPVRPYSTEDGDVTMTDVINSPGWSSSPARPLASSPQVDQNSVQKKLIDDAIHGPIWPKRNIFDDEFDTMEEVGRKLAQSIEDNAPKHHGGVLNGLSDWRGYEGLVKQLSEETIKEVESMMQDIGEAVIAAVRKGAGSADGSSSGR